MTALKSRDPVKAVDDAAALKPSARQRLMDASEQLFAEHGWNAVSIRTIVAAAGVNLAALHYHFGSKEQLLAEIFTARAKPIAEERMRLLGEIDIHRTGDGVQVTHDHHPSRFSMSSHRSRRLEIATTMRSAM